MKNLSRKAAKPQREAPFVVRFFLDGNQWCAVEHETFNSLADSPAGFGNSPQEAMVELCREIARNEKLTDPARLSRRRKERKP